MNGLQVLKEIRNVSDTPVLMLTALSDERTQITSFDSLADDYMTKPFSIVLLGKRVLALLRRAGKIEAKDIWKYGHYSAGFTLDTYTHVTGEMQKDAAQRMGSFMAQAV